MGNELKPCPFCGHRAILRHDQLSKISRADRPGMCVGDYFASWTVECVYCGIPKLTYRTSYVFDNNGQLRVVDGKDGRIEAIEKWNRRVGDDISERMVDDGK